MTLEVYRAVPFVNELLDHFAIRFAPCHEVPLAVPANPIPVPGVLITQVASYAKDEVPRLVPVLERKPLVL